MVTDPTGGKTKKKFPCRGSHLISTMNHEYADEIGHVTIGVIFSFLLEIPNDAYMLLSQILIGYSHSVKSTANNKKATLHFNMPMLNNFIFVEMADC